MHSSASISARSRLLAAFISPTIASLNSFVSALSDSGLTCPVCPCLPGCPEWGGCRCPRNAPARFLLHLPIVAGVVPQRRGLRVQQAKPYWWSTHLLTAQERISLCFLCRLSRLHIQFAMQLWIHRVHPRRAHPSPLRVEGNVSFAGRTRPHAAACTAQKMNNEY